MLNKYYRKEKCANSLINNGFLSHFDKDSIVKGSKDSYIISSSIEELKKLTLSFTSTNYVYFLGYWYQNPIDVENIFFKHDKFKNHFEESGHYHLEINTYYFFISKSSKKQNLNVSKVVIIKDDDKPIFVLCMERNDIVAYNIQNQMCDIYTLLTSENESLKKAKWYNFSSENVDPFLDYQLSKVNFDENRSPTWEKNVFWDDITKDYNIEGFEEILKSMSSQL